MITNVLPPFYGSQCRSMLLLMKSFVMLTCHVVTFRCYDVQIVAVAARSLERAQQFAQKHGIRSAYGSYESLAHDADVG